jgi:hypothetical protein
VLVVSHVHWARSICTATQLFRAATDLGNISGANRYIDSNIEEAGYNPAEITPAQFSLACKVGMIENKRSAKSEKAMQRGNDEENEAAELLERATGLEIHHLDLGVMVQLPEKEFGASPDRICRWVRALIEIKSKDRFNMWGKEFMIDNAHYLQMQQQMATTGIPNVLYVQYISPRKTRQGLEKPAQLCVMLVPWNQQFFDNYYLMYIKPFSGFLRRAHALVRDAGGVAGDVDSVKWVSLMEELDASIPRSSTPGKARVGASAAATAESPQQRAPWTRAPPKAKRAHSANEVMRACSSGVDPSHPRAPTRPPVAPVCVDPVEMTRKWGMIGERDPLTMPDAHRQKTQAEKETLTSRIVHTAMEMGRKKDETGPRLWRPPPKGTAPARVTSMAWTSPSLRTIDRSGDPEGHASVLQPAEHALSPAQRFKALVAELETEQRVEHHHAYSPPVPPPAGHGQSGTHARNQPSPPPMHGSERLSAAPQRAVGPTQSQWEATTSAWSKGVTAMANSLIRRDAEVKSQKATQKRTSSNKKGAPAAKKAKRTKSA